MIAPLHLLRASPKKGFLMVTISKYRVGLISLLFVATQLFSVGFDIKKELYTASATLKTLGGRDLFFPSDTFTRAATAWVNNLSTFKKSIESQLTGGSLLGKDKVSTKNVAIIKKALDQLTQYSSTFFTSSLINLKGALGDHAHNIIISKRTGSFALSGPEFEQFSKAVENLEKLTKSIAAISVPDFSDDYPKTNEIKNNLRVVKGFLKAFADNAWRVVRDDLKPRIKKG